MQKAERLKYGARLYIPPRLAKVIPPESRFEVELTEDGILFRRVDPQIVIPPSWVIKQYTS